ncbi:extracellular solute-binding protein [Frigidibacter sp. SD6-1]|uniref:ABC transporter substrate-binding protein n=1 Tax=Frigidibacter sp. SD6-1 TaxID=3032581 RepID=UPI0024DFDFB4|nr:extracellular solute-binding protein [Frigidibacter sp. SD6-1]
MQRVKFIDRMAQGKLSRRDMLQSAGAFGVGLIALPRLARAQGGPLTCLEWGGYDAEEYVGAYVSKHGALPDFSIFSGEEEALAKVRAGFAADVMHPCNYSVSRFVNAGLVTEIDTSKLSNWADVFPALQTAEGVVQDGKVVMAPADWGNSSIAYRSDLIDPAFVADPTWAIFYDEAYAGKVSMLDNEVAFQIGAMVGGMPYDEAYKLSGAALEEAAKTWGAKAVNVSRFLWNDPSEVQQAMASGEIVAAYAWNDLVKNLKAEGIPVEYAKPKEGMFTWFCGLTMLNSGKADPALAYDFIDAWLSPETGKYLIESSGYGHANMKSFEVADPAEVAAMGITDPEAMMGSSILFRTPTDEVQVEHNRVWGDIKALKM